MEEYVLSTGQRKRIIGESIERYVLLMGAQRLLELDSKYVLGMGQRSKYAAKRDAQAKSDKEECAINMGQERGMTAIR
jgi:hypothetical protein